MKHLRIILRLGFGAIFIWSGIAKLKYPISFADAVRNFELVNDPLAPAAALLIPWIEIIAGIFTMSGKMWKGSVFTLLLSLLIFTFALAFAWARGLDISCGCFGGTGAVNFPLMVSRNLGLIIVGWLLLKIREAPLPPFL